MYFMIFMMAIPAFQMSSLSANMLKCSGNMRIPSMVSILVCLLDVVFNYIFIYLLDLGVCGAAIGTAIAISIGAIISSWFAMVRSSMLSLVGRGEHFRYVSTYLRNAMGISAPMAFQGILMGIAQVVSTMIVAPLGNIAIAANTFAITVESLCYMPGYGIGEAATTLVGQSIGEMVLRVKTIRLGEIGNFITKQEFKT
jgi:Na+-driven multidrug efflux pump